MQNRRTFLRLGGLAVAGLSTVLKPGTGQASQSAAIQPANITPPNFNPQPVQPNPDGTYPSQRPPVGQRQFRSTIIEQIISQITPTIRNKKLAWMFENCFPNTLDTTVFYSEPNGRPDTFVITGDIAAMWQRDSAAQVWPYLPYAKQDPALQKLILGVINRQTQNTAIDPYANAFNDGPTGQGHQDDLTQMNPNVFERKYEIDSLCYPVRLAYNYWKQTGDTSAFDTAWIQAATSIVNTLQTQQRKNGPGPYSFQRVTPVATDTLPLGGYGNPIMPVGLICSMFRPSDDATIFPFLVPSNLFAVLALKQIAEIAYTVLGSSSLASSAFNLATEVETAIRNYAVRYHPNWGPIYAYEVDGYGNASFMDDANVPSLLGALYLGTVSQNDPLYWKTRGLVLSATNPYFFQGTAAEGIGGPHVGLNYIWPMSLIIRGISSNDVQEVKLMLDTLIATDGNCGVMHESFYKHNPSNYTRPWFAWANTLFGEFVLKIARDYPALLAS
jgi:hypothetical protein